jgi:hypothetical protein
MTLTGPPLRAPDLLYRAVATSQCNSPLGSASLATSGVQMLEVVMPRFGIECYTGHGGATYASANTSSTNATLGIVGDMPSSRLLSRHIGVRYVGLRSPGAAVSLGASVNGNVIVILHQVSTPRHSWFEARQSKA